MFQIDRIKALFRKYINDELSDTECRELVEWIDSSPKNKELFLHFISLYKSELQLKSSRFIRRQKIELPKKEKRRFVRSFSVAASVLLLLGAGIFFYMLKSGRDIIGREKPLTEIFTNEGSKIAYLTISDGSTFPLSSEYQTVVQERNGHVVGYNEMSHLSYKSILNELNKSFRNEIAVPRGGEYSLTLSDGSNVWINAQSRLEYPVVFASVRSVNLSGEAFFEVAADEENPFVVHVGDVQVKAVGTKFNIASYGKNQVVVTLNEGIVEITANNREFVLCQDNQSETHNCCRKQARQHRTPHEGNQLEIRNGQATIKTVNPEMYSSWVTGTFEFENTPLSEIVTQLALWYDVEFEFTEKELGQINFSGAILKNKSLGYALELIRKVSGVNFHKKGDVIAVSKDK